MRGRRTPDTSGFLQFHQKRKAPLCVWCQREGIGTLPFAKIDLQSPTKVRAGFCSSNVSISSFKTQNNKQSPLREQRWKSCQDILTIVVLQDLAFLLIFNSSLWKAQGHPAPCLHALGLLRVGWGSHRSGHLCSSKISSNDPVQARGTLRTSPLKSGN